jgi:hypothetical protein
MFQAQQMTPQDQRARERTVMQEISTSCPDQTINFLCMVWNPRTPKVGDFNGEDDQSAITVAKGDLVRVHNSM